MITPRQKQILDYLTRYIDANGYAPTMKEIGKQFNLSSPASVYHILRGLEDNGAIRRIPNVSRGIEIIKDEQRNDGKIPLLGTVTAGQPITAILNYETLDPAFQSKARLFALRVSGDSMTNEQIRDGDCLILEQRHSIPADGEMVVALVDGGDATVKRFYVTKGGVRLEPTNPRFKPITVTADRVEIQGVITGVIRRY